MNRKKKKSWWQFQKNVLNGSWTGLKLLRNYSEFLIELKLSLHKLNGRGTKREIEISGHFGRSIRRCCYYSNWIEWTKRRREEENPLWQTWRHIIYFFCDASFLLESASSSSVFKPIDHRFTCKDQFICEQRPDLLNLPSDLIGKISTACFKGWNSPPRSNYPVQFQSRDWADWT